MNKFLPVLSLSFFTLLLLVASCKKNDEVINVGVENISSSNISQPIVSSVDNSAVDIASKSVFLYEQCDNIVYNMHKYQGCPSIGSDGNAYFAAWQTGGTGEQPGNYITVAVSTDGGNTWKQHKLIITSNDANVRHFDPMFWKDKFGNLNLTWASSTGMWDGAALGAWYISLKYVNNKVVITKPKFMFHGIMNTKPTPVGTDSSKMVFPVSGFIVSNPWNQFPVTPTPADLAGAFVYESNYTGSSLEQPVKTAKINTTGLSINYAEMMITALNKNTYQAIIRTKSTIYTAKSTDAGITWSTPKNFTDLGATTSSKSYFGKLKSGHILFVLNNSTTRTMLTAYLSKDNGKTWPYKVLLDARNNVSYPDVYQAANGEIFVVYDRERAGEQEINLLKLSEQDIIGGSLSHPPVVISHK